MLTRSYLFSFRGLGRFALAFYVLCISTPMQAQAPISQRNQQWAKEFIASHPKEDDTLNFILFFAIIISLIVIIFALNDIAFNKSKRLKKLFRIQDKPTPEIQIYPKHFTDELKKRFPASKIYYVPERMRALTNTDPEGGNPAYRENCDDWWSRMLRMYPQPPRDEAEREQREAGFWHMYAQHFSVVDSTQKPVLKPKQDILDFFKYWEKWIFRDFYAATGVVHKSIVEETVRHVFDYEDARAMKTFGDNTSLSNTQKRQETDKALDAEKRFVHETLPAHYEKWGGWFYFHVQQSFQAQHQTEADYGPQSAVSSAHPADDDLSYKPNS